MIAIFLANGFEMIEALTPCDVLKRAGGDVRLVSLTDSLTVTSTHKISVKCDLTLRDIQNESFELLILPGGMPGADNLFAAKPLCELLVKENAKNTPIAAICAAPYVLGELGILSGKKATCYPGFEEHLKGAEVTSTSVVTSQNTVTAKGMGVSLDFSLALTELLYGKEKKEAVKAQIMAE